MRDDTRSATFERREHKVKLAEQFDMLQEQQADVLYPKNDEMQILQKQLEDKYFT